MTGNANAILFARKGQAYRGKNLRGNYRGRGKEIIVVITKTISTNNITAK